MIEILNSHEGEPAVSEFPFMAIDLTVVYLGGHLRQKHYIISALMQPAEPSNN
jgi:hypothetical protein